MGAYTATIRRNSDRIQILTSREGNAWGIPLTLKKGITLNAGVNALEIAYFIEGLPQDRELHFWRRMEFCGGFPMPSTTAFLAIQTEKNWVIWDQS